MAIEEKTYHTTSWSYTRNRVIHNLVQLPQRSFKSLARRLQSAYKIQRQADRYVRDQMDSTLYEALCSIPGNTSARKCRLLFYLACTTPADGVILEVGAFKGKSTAWLAEAARRTKRRLVSIDPHLLGSYDEFRKTVDRFGLESVATLHCEMSHDIGKDWSEPIAFLWIDGGHDYQSVRDDVIDFTPHVQPNGITVFDDVDEQVFPGVVQAINELIRDDPSFVLLGKIKSIGMYRRVAP